MRKLSVYNSITLDGYFTGANGDFSWAHRQDPKHEPEFQEFVESNARGGGELLFGRITYELMASYWPTPMAIKNDPVVAARMNDLPKVVGTCDLAQIAVGFPFLNEELVAFALPICSTRSASPSAATGSVATSIACIVASSEPPCDSV